MVRDANGQKQAIVGDMPGLLCVKCVGHCFSGNHLELQFLNRRKTAWFAAQILCRTAYEDVSSGGVLWLQFSVVRYFQSKDSDLQAGGRLFNGKIFFDSSGLAQQIFIIISIYIQFFPFQIPTCSLHCFHFVLVYLSSSIFSVASYMWISATSIQS